MFPFRAARRIETTPYITIGLVLVNVVVFLWQLTLNEPDLRNLFLTAGFVPCKIGANLVSTDSLFSSITSMFLHGGWLHLIFNMLYLVAFGPMVESYLGKPLYLLFYITAGLGAGLTHLLFNLNNCTPAIGASGAIMGVMGGFMLLFPGTRIRTLNLFPFGIKRISALTLLGGYFLLDLFNGILSLNATTETTNGVAVWAHVGGFLAGLVLSFFIMTFKPLPPVDPLAHLDED